MATKEDKRFARGLIEGLESRVHAGPPVLAAEIHSAQEFLRQSQFPPASDYFSRLTQIRARLESRTNEPPLPRAKRDYGGEAAGRWMQVQSAYDHVILSICYDGEQNQQRGRIKISHRFNQEGRIDFVELKFLRSMQPLLNGAIRKLLCVQGYQTIRKDWHAAPGFVLEVLPRELIFLYQDIFRCPRRDLLSWLVNIGHRQVGDLLQELSALRVNGCHASPSHNPDQLCLSALAGDAVAMPILEKACSLECAVDMEAPKTVVVRYSNCSR